MNGSIYVIQENGRLGRMEQQDYDSEALLQGLLCDYPDLLAGDQIDPNEPRRWLLVDREAPVPSEEGGAERFCVDHLFLDQDGIPTLIEVKRSSDTRVRREVVGQMLDYAANAVAYWPAERLRADYEARCETQQADPAEVFAEAFGTEVDYDGYWQQVKTNLLAKRIRLLFVADRIPPELRRIIEFLNETMDPVQVLGLEIRQYGGQARRALVPTVIGKTGDADQKKGTQSAKKKLTENEFLAKCDGQARANFEKLLAFAQKQQLSVRWGTRGFSLNVVLEDRHTSIFEGYDGQDAWASGWLVYGGITHKVARPEAIVAKYKELVATIKGLQHTPKFDKVPFASMADAEVEQLLRIFETIVTMIKEHGLGV